MLRLSVCALVSAFLSFHPAWGQEKDDFHGKEISLLIGAGAGGGSDLYARVFARHFTDHLPGAPKVIPRNVPGAGGLRLANQLFSGSPKNGTEIALFLAAAVLEPLFGNKDAKFETTRFNWI